jgi:F-type H+-transporting ATPase subunit b
MESLVSTFHLDVKLLLAQMVNFAIVVGVLYWFAFKPLLKTMGERSSKIEQGLKEAEEISNRLNTTKAEQTAILKQAKVDAASLLEEARALSEDKKNQMVAKAKEEVGKLIVEEKAKIQEAKEKTLAEIKAEVTDLVVLVAEKVLREKVNSKTDNEIIAKALK